MFAEFIANYFNGPMGDRARLERRIMRSYEYLEHDIEAEKNGRVNTMIPYFKQRIPEKASELREEFRAGIIALKTSTGFNAGNRFKFGNLQLVVNESMDAQTRRGETSIVSPEDQPYSFRLEPLGVDVVLESGNKFPVIKYNKRDEYTGEVTVEEAKSAGSYIHALDILDYGRKLPLPHRENIDQQILTV